MAAAEALRALLDAAHEALLAGDAADAERRAKAVSAIVRAERDMAEHLVSVRSQTPEEDAEAIRAELRSRFRRLAEEDEAGAPADVLERLAAGAPAG